MTTTVNTEYAPSSIGGNCLALLGRIVSHWWRDYTVWRNQQLAIAALQRLDNRTLKDIGIDRSEITSAVRTAGKERNPKFFG